MFNKTQLAVLIGGIFALSTGAYAETFTMEEVTVSATRTNQTIEDTAASVVVTTDEDIEKNLANDVGDLFDYTPGVTVQSDSRQGIQSVNIRGMEGNRIKILVDGVSQANQFENTYSFINSGRVDIDTDMIKSVEVVKGAASSLQGSDAIGGIVAFQTKDPSDFLQGGKDVGGHVKLGYSSADNTFSESVAIANRFGDVETLLTYTRKDGEELDNFGDTDDQDTSADNVLLKVQYQVNKAHRVEFTGEYVGSDTDTTYADDVYDPYTSEDISEKYRVGLKHIWLADFSFADTVTTQVDYLSKKENGITNRTCSSPTVSAYGASCTQDNVQKKDYRYEDSGYQADVQFEKSFQSNNAEHFFVYGMSYSAKDISNTNNEYNSIDDDEIVFYMPNASETRYGVFAQDEVSIGAWTLTPGVRFDSFTTDPGDDIPDNDGGFDEDSYTKYSDSAITGRLGAVYAINNRHKVFGQVSQGFRAPDFQELFYSYSNPTYGYTSVPNTDLEAETSISYELGWRYNTSAVSSEIAVFYSDYDDFIDSTSEENDDTGLTEYSYQNLDTATIKGIEVSNRLDLHELLSAPQGITTQIAAAYTEGEDGNGDALNSVSPWSAVVGLNYDAPSAKWGSSIKVVYTAGKDEDDITPSTDYSGNDNDVFAPDSSTVVDLTAYYMPMDNLTLRAGVFNLTNEEYYNWNDVRGLTEEDKFYTQAKRNFAVTAKLDF